jgi:hypothetical protein
MCVLRPYRSVLLILLLLTDRLVQTSLNAKLLSGLDVVLRPIEKVRSTLTRKYDGGGVLNRLSRVPQPQ